MATLAQPWVTGPAHFFVGRLPGFKIGFGNGPAAPPIPPIYLGTAEKTPNILTLRGWFQVFNDFTGPVLPMDEGWAQEHGFESCNLTRFSWPAVNLLQSCPTFGGEPGSWDPFDVGTMMLTEEAALTLWIAFPYSVKPAYLGMPVGYRFPAVLPYGPDDFNQLGTNAARLGLVFHSLPAFNGSRFVHRDYDMTAVAGIPVY